MCFRTDLPHQTRRLPKTRNTNRVLVMGYSHTKLLIIIQFGRRQQIRSEAEVGVGSKIDSYWRREERNTEKERIRCRQWLCNNVNYYYKSIIGLLSNFLAGAAKLLCARGGRRTFLGGRGWPRNRLFAMNESFCSDRQRLHPHSVKLARKYYIIQYINYNYACKRCAIV